MLSDKRAFSSFYMKHNFLRMLCEMQKIRTLGMKCGGVGVIAKGCPFGWCRRYRPRRHVLRGRALSDFTRFDKLYLGIVYLYSTLVGLFDDKISSFVCQSCSRDN
jgi:hypothetical protein